MTRAEIAAVLQDVVAYSADLYMLNPDALPPPDGLRDRTTAALAALEQPPTVTEGMIDAACTAYSAEAMHKLFHGEGDPMRVLMRVAVEAAMKEMA